VGTDSLALRGEPAGNIRADQPPGATRGKRSLPIGLGVRDKFRAVSPRTLTGMLAALAIGALLAGCGSASAGNSSSSSKSAARTSSTSVASTAEAPPRPQVESIPQARGKCRRAVRAAPLLPAQSKSELDGVCGKINGAIQDDRRLLGVVCHEVANGSPISKESARARAYSTCFAEGTK
jgi:hypothetical protein